MILLFLYFFKISNVFFSTVSGAACESNLTLHDLIVLLDLLQSAVKLIKLLLCLQHTLELLICFFFFSFILSLQYLMLAFSLDTIALNNIVIVVGALEGGLHFCQLMLHPIELNTCLFTCLAHFPNFLFLLTKLQIDAFVLVGKLLGQGVLEARHQGLKNKTLGGYIHGQQAKRFLLHRQRTDLHPHPDLRSQGCHPR